jgi:putative ABC transport system substrate-binding protein
VVFVGASDPVGNGLAASLGRPGGNMTGLSRAVEDGTLGKAMQVLKEIVTGAERVAILWNPDARVNARHREAEAAARSLGMEPVSFGVRDRSGFGTAFFEMRRRHMDAMVVVGDPLTLVNRATIVKLAAESRIPAVYEFAEFARDGGLVAYAPSVVALFHRAAAYVDKIFNGASPGDLPIEQPTKFELVVNLKTAKALGLTIPQSLRLRADEVIQ